jgi:mannose-6-phosphate isomerase-like protein (cupin superfamily)
VSVSRKSALGKPVEVRSPAAASDVVAWRGEEISMPNDPGPHALREVRAILAPGGAVTSRRVTPRFYEEVDAEFQGFGGHVLVSEHAFDEPWPTWEMHPNGDEIVYLIEGDTDFVLHDPAGDRVLRVSEPGSYVVVPRGTWHTARPHTWTIMLFITPGEGTQNRESPG